MSRRHLLPLPIQEVPFVLRLEEMTPPFSWPQVFGRPGPVELEIGSGKGLFLLAASQLRPESNFLGVERAGKWFQRAVERIHHAGRENIRLARTDAFDLLARWVPPGSLAALHVYFPDPWPKKRHAKRRLLQRSLYTLGARALAPDGAFLLASDVEEYFQQAVEEVEGLGLYASVPWPPEAPDRVPTHYALKYVRQGRALHYARFRRLPCLPPSGPPAAVESRSDSMLGSPGKEVG